jgi:hypothetical protein
MLFILGLCSSLMAQEPRKTAATALEKSQQLDTDHHLVGWWKLREAAGNIAADSAASPHPGTLAGGLAFAAPTVPGVAGAGLQFTGKDACVRINGFKGVTGPGPRTICVWIKTSAPTGELVSWGGDAAGKMWTLGFIRSRIGVTPKGGYLYMKAPVHDDVWHQVAVVVQEASPPNLHDHVKLFRDGTLAEIDDIGLLDLFPIETGDKNDVRIGGRFKGLMRDVRIYARALSEDEIKALYIREKS